MDLLNILLQATTGDGTGGDGAGTNQIYTIGMFVLIFVVFYFFMIRPQQKKQKELQKARESMKVNDKVILAGSGIYGKIKEVKETAFIIEIAENVRVKVDKSAVYNVSDAPEQQGK